VAVDERARLAGLELHYDAFGRLVLVEASGRRHVGVEPIRAFPLSDPQRSISICNAEGVEVLWIDDLASLGPTVRRLLEEELMRREFMPVIEQVASVSSPTEPSEWEVTTDRGPTRFVLKTDDDIRRIGQHGAMLVDSAGTRYLVPDFRRLDAASRRVFERYL
jgi:hypothetical protein